MKDWLIVIAVAIAYGLVGKDDLDEQIAREPERAERMPAAVAPFDSWPFEPTRQLMTLSHPCEARSLQETADDQWQERCAQPAPQY